MTDPETGSGDPVRALLVVRVEIKPGHEDETDRWYEEEHLPERRAMPGFLTARSYRSPEHPNQRLTIYELSDPTAPTSPTYMSQPQSARTQQVMAGWDRWERAVWELVDPSLDEPTDP